ncbi:MAG: glucose-6-phosphate isomerase [Oscillospiraceae bacterium]|nr:glucose-6-phosphate isomerase [Oscillospiraceae bacterium]
MLKVDLSGATSFFDAAGPDYAAAAAAHRTLAEHAGSGAEFTGWLELPQRVKNGELKQILSAASKIRGRSEALVVIGIGGSYLGAKGAVELLRPRPQAGDPRIFFAGNSMSPDALMLLLDELGEMDFDLNVISKSGTTLEPALAFRMFRGLLNAKYGPEKAKKRIIATTDAHKGVLKSMADEEGWETFVVPDDVGGRYSVLSPVGLLPMAAAGIDVQAVVNAAIDAFAAMDLRSPENPAWQYAAARQHLYQLGKSIEILACYEPSFRYMAEWWKQLYGESEGKNGIGIYPASVEYNADLHSMGQYIQDGPRTLMETVVTFEAPNNEFTVPFAMGDPDQLNYLAGRKLSEISRSAQEAVKAAHIAGGVPNLEVRVGTRDEAGFAWLVCFFELACALSGYMSGVNPFDQPGVEAYKKNMFRLLGKPDAV